MSRCHFCGKTIDNIPFECHRCGNIFCSDHRLPEYHQCAMLNVNPSFAYIPKPVTKKKTQSGSVETLMLNNRIALFLQNRTQSFPFVKGFNRALNLSNGERLKEN
jgi:hypothetical protein